MSDFVEEEIQKTITMLPAADTTVRISNCIFHFFRMEKMPVFLTVGGICKVGRQFIAAVIYRKKQEQENLEFSRNFVPFLQILAGLLIYALITHQFGEMPRETELDFSSMKKQFRDEMTSLLANFSIAVNCRFKE
jgi:hypothetical protein